MKQVIFQLSFQEFNPLFKKCMHLNPNLEGKQKYSWKHIQDPCTPISWLLAALGLP